MLKRFLKNERGLTLVELLAVIVILGVIAAIAVPSIGGLINKTKQDATVAEAQQIISAAKLAHASKANKNAWKYNTSSTVPANSSYKYGPELDPYLDNVDDTDFIVVYDGTTYVLVNHEAVEAVITKANGAAGITEKQILDYTNAE